MDVTCVASQSNKQTPCYFLEWHCKKRKKKIRFPPPLLLISVLDSFIQQNHNTADSLLRCNDGLFWKTIPCWIVCPKTILPRCQRAVHLVAIGTLTIDAFVQLHGTEPAGPDRLDTQRIKLALAARARTRKCLLLCDAQTRQRQFVLSNKITSLRLSRKINVGGGHRRWQLH